TDTQTHTHTQTQTQTHRHTDTHTHRHTDTQTHRHTHTHTHTHTQTPTHTKVDRAAYLRSIADILEKGGRKKSRRLDDGPFFAQLLKRERDESVKPSCPQKDQRVNKHQLNCLFFLF